MPRVVSSATCPQCGFPISGRPGQIANCPNCGIGGMISGISIPDPLFWGSIGILVGLILSKSKYVASKLAKI